MSDINGDIEFDEVSFVYPSRHQASVLNRLSLIARAGQTTALVGSSGCGKYSSYKMHMFQRMIGSIGKSTCVSLLLRQYDLSSGEITINGQSINNYHLKQLRQNIGVVSQEPVCISLWNT